MFIANRVVSVLRGQGKDEYGDPIDLDLPVHTSIPANISEVDAIVTTESEGMGRVVRILQGRLPSGTDVQDGDRLLDERSSEIFIIERITQSQSPIMATGVRLDLRRVT